jgi:integrase
VQRSTKSALANGSQWNRAELFYPLSTARHSGASEITPWSPSCLGAACGAELAAAQVKDLQQREEHWVFADLIGKGGHIRTVPIPDWVAEAIRVWLTEAGVIDGAVFRTINKAGRIAPVRFSPINYLGRCQRSFCSLRTANVPPHDLRRTCAYVIKPGENS